jgi:PqqA peptide cyclase
MTTAATVSAPIGLLAEHTPLSFAARTLQKLEKPAAELSMAQWQDVLTQAAALGVLQLHLSGGEPTVRRDLEDLVRHAAALGLDTYLITSAYGVTRDRLAAPAEASLDHVQISI